MNISVNTLLFTMLTSFMGCNQTTKQTDNTEKTTKDSEMELFTFYSKDGNKIKVARAISIDTGKYGLYRYEIDITTPEGSVQNILSVDHLTSQELVVKRNEIESEYSWTPFSGEKILFVQIQPVGFRDELDLLDKRQDIEGKLNEVLGDNQLGEWVAGDLGPGGGNMLFAIVNIDKSMPLILEQLQGDKLLEKVLIGRRVMISDGDWFYDVIYPLGYSGSFNTM